MDRRSIAGISGAVIPTALFGVRITDIEAQSIAKSLASDAAAIGRCHEEFAVISAVAASRFTEETGIVRFFDQAVARNLNGTFNTDGGGRATKSHPVAHGAER